MAASQLFFQKLLVDISGFAALFVGGPVEFLILHFLASRSNLFERSKETEASSTVEARSELCNFKPAEDVNARVSKRQNARGSACYDQSRSQGMALLEQYAVFGTGPGEWSPSWDEGKEEQLIDAIEEALDEKLDADSKADVRAGACRNSAFDLLDHYSAFGAAPGAWSGSSPSPPSASLGSWSERLDEEEEHEDLIDVPEEEYVDELDADSMSDIRADGYRNDAFALLEHYGVFGAAQGSWSGGSPPLPPASPRSWSKHMDVEDEDEDLITNSEDLDAELEVGGEPNAQFRGCLGNASELLEHYGVFGAAPGAWSHSLPLPLSPLASRPSVWSERLVVAEEDASDVLKADSFDELGPATDYDLRSGGCSMTAFVSIPRKTDSEVCPVLLGRTSKAGPVLLGRTSKVGPVLLGRYTRPDVKYGLKDNLPGKSSDKAIPLLQHAASCTERSVAL